MQYKIGATTNAYTACTVNQNSWHRHRIHFKAVDVSSDGHELGVNQVTVTNANYLEIDYQDLTKAKGNVAQKRLFRRTVRS